MIPEPVEQKVNQESIGKALEKIADKDPNMFKGIEELIIYLSKTYEDKYANSPIKNTGVIYSKNLGKGFNGGNASKYLGRYLTEGFDKSELILDLFKTIHYSLFEYVRKKFY